MNKKNNMFLIFLGLVVLSLVISSSALAQTSPTPEPTLTPEATSEPDYLSINEQEDHGNTNCLMCHFDPNFSGHLPDGDVVSLYIDPSVFYRSVHAEVGLECVACHSQQKAYPHQNSGQVSCQDCHEDLDRTENAQYRPISVDLEYNDEREITLALNENCRSCHGEHFDEATDSAHVRVQEAGNRHAPVCVDCHGSHDITPPGQPRTKISETCASCHLAVYTTYQSSIHGSALTEESNPDVPTCVDCHGVHSVRGPRNVEFHNDTVVICGNCHADEGRMERYGISTQVFETYLDDFHGRTVNFFRSAKSNAPSNKATCFDCHGIHNIRAADDPSSMVYPNNLQNTCQQCHADAGISFPDAWLSHYIPTWEETPALYGVNIVYAYMVPSLTGCFLLYIALDARRRLTHRHRSSEPQQFIEIDMEEDAEE